MNKQLFYKVSISIVSGFLIIWLTAFTVYLSQQPEEETPVQPSQAEQPAPIQASPAKTTPPAAQQAVTNAGITHYLAIIQNGKIAIYDVYTNGYSQLQTVLEDIDPNMLRAEDRKQFEAGMTLYSQQEVASLIEDFSS